VKPLAELTIEDLESSPVWRYEGGSGPDALVAPTTRSSLSREDDEIFLAATDFELFDSTRCFGFCFPADDSGLDYIQPVIVSPSRHISFWFDGPASPEALEAQWRALGKRCEDIFPVAFRCLVPVDGRTVSGRIAGVESSRDLTEGPAPDAPEPPPRAVPIERGPAAAPAPERIPTARPVVPRRDTGAIEKRTARRRKAKIKVDFSQGSFQGSGVTEDVSPRGMFVRSSQIPGTGPALRLTVNLPEGRKLVVTGRVVRSATSLTPASASGFGLRIAHDSPEYQELLARLRKKE
jgi:hypothetical protein